MVVRIVALLALCLGSAVAFAPQRTASARSATQLKAFDDDKVRETAAKFFAGAFLLSNLATVAPAFAAFEEDFGSSQVIAARSGGRAGGRAARAPSRAPSSRTTYKSTTIYQSAPAAPAAVYVAPPVYGGYGYNPVPGLGLGLGLNAIGAIGEGLREARQEGEIRDTRNQLQQERLKEQELEMRLRQLENQNMRGYPQQAPPMAPPPQPAQ